MIPFPASDGDELFREYNRRHYPGGAADHRGGEFAPRDTTAGATTVVRVRRVNSVTEAIPLILAGQNVELRDTTQVHTLLNRLARMAQDAAARGDAAPTYDLCKVSVKGTNLFCADKLRTVEYPNGVPRLQMPQFKGVPRPGSEADRLPKNQRGNVDGTEAFLRHLHEVGITFETKLVRASKLRASQSELIGSKVAAMMTKPGFDPHDGRIFVSRDHYVVDGHHRWASVVGLDAKDGRLGDLKMPVYKINAPISQILHLATAWTRQFGIQGKGA